jgi:hypothetical protein
MKRGQMTKKAVPGNDVSGVRADEPLRGTDDPGGAHAKGYSADRRPEVLAPAEDPVPLAPAHVPTAEVRQHERDADVHPTGRSEGGDYTPNDRLMGSDR